MELEKNNPRLLVTDPFPRKKITTLSFVSFVPAPGEECPGIVQHIVWNRKEDGRCNTNRLTLAGHCPDTF
jgi:hypothetical protein